jgi:hypothetical protein
LFAAARLELHPVLWTTCAGDWRADATPASVARAVRTGFVQGGTVLLHDASRDPTSDAWRSAVGALPLLAAHFDAVGLAVGPLAEHRVIRRAVKTG